MATIKDFSVERPAYIYGDARRRVDRDELIEANVVKIGRKYVTVKAKSGSWEMRFSEGYTRGKAPFFVEDTEYGSPRMLFPTKESADEWIELEELRNRIEKAFRWDSIRKYTLEQLRAVSKIIEEGGQT